jgi:hypothetical protein
VLVGERGIDVPCVGVGKKNRGGSEGLLEALHAGKGKGTG